MTDQELRLQELEAELKKLQRELAPKWKTWSLNEVNDFLSRKVNPLRKQISSARAALTRTKRNKGAA